MLRNRVGVVLTAAIAAAGVIGWSSVSQATTEPAVAQVSWSFIASNVSAGRPNAFEYSISGYRPGDRLVLQREFGTSRVWKTVITVSASASGAATAPSDSMGRFAYRAQVLSSRGLLIAGSGIHYLYSFGNVPMSAFGNEPETLQGGANWLNGSVQVGSNLFSYQMQGNVIGSGCGSSQPPQWCTEIQFPQTSCRTLTLQFAVESYGKSGDVANVQIIQSADDPVAASATEGSIRTFTAHLDGGPWYLEDNSTDGSVLYYAGRASCWTANGER